MKSILQAKKECFICKRTDGLHLHHCLTGKNRKTSDKHGFTVYLCVNHHTGDEGVHKDETALRVFKTLCQKEFEKTHTREEFLKIIGRNYL